MHFLFFIVFILNPFYFAEASSRQVKTFPNKTNLTKKDLSKIDFSILPSIGATKFLIDDKKNNSTASLTSRPVLGASGKFSLSKKNKTIFIKSEMSKVSFAQSSEINISNREQDTYSFEAGVLFGQKFNYGMVVGRKESLFLSLRDSNYILEKLAQVHLMAVGEASLYQNKRWRLRLNISPGLIFPSKNDYISSKMGHQINNNLIFQQLKRDGGWIFGLDTNYRNQSSDKIELLEMGLKFTGGYHLYF